ncbi:MAG: hypothetical protein AB7L76_23690 [Burkholderiaceae bacterium]
MSPEQHLAKAERILKAMDKLTEADFEMVIEASMLAGTHLLNAALHRMKLTEAGDDVMHAEYLSSAIRTKTTLIAGPLVEALQAIEEMRPFYVRGDVPNGEGAARRCLDLLEYLHVKADTAKPYR